MKGVVKTIIEFVVGLALLPTAGAFVAYVSADANLSGILGFTLLLSAGLVIVAIAVIWNAVKEVMD